MFTEHTDPLDSYIMLVNVTNLFSSLPIESGGIILNDLLTDVGYVYIHLFIYLWIYLFTCIYLFARKYKSLH
jgi:hypothetical protein